ncbi:cytochrome c oxidase assembly factor Coa1 family protein [Rasiella sp. SM2506]|uniref:cytochrome c oxidase assembly factor Coa1 family protein n=1 Tax=Rasiella sp. SM2506 TaxID=3423914 RepID=UPI003D7A68BC
MNNELLQKKSWWKRNWKWLVGFSALLLISTIIFFTSNMESITTNLVQAYADPELYENALKKVKADKRVTELLGDIQPIDKLAILEGQVAYSDHANTVQSTVRIIGDKGKANMDISAERINTIWKYTKINIRIKNPPENKQTIEIDTAE